jgi:hypothetical protein
VKQNNILKLLEFVEINDIDAMLLEEKHFDSKDPMFKGIFREDEDFEEWAYSISQDMVACYIQSKNHLYNKSRLFEKLEIKTDYNGYND